MLYMVILTWAPEKRNEVLRLLQGPVKFLDLKEPQKRAIRMRIDRKVRSLSEMKYMTAETFLEELEGEFRRIFDANYGLEKQIRDLLTRHWDK